MGYEDLRAEIEQARADETKAKAQIYTLRGKKGLQAMAAAMGEELPPHLSSSHSTIFEDPEDSPQIQELRRQLALLKDMEAQQRNQIEQLKEKKAARLARAEQEKERENAAAAASAMEIPRVQNTSSSSNFGGITLDKEPEQPVSNISLNKSPTPNNPPPKDSGVILEKNESQPLPPTPVPQPVEQQRSMPPAASASPSTPKTPLVKGKSGKLTVGPPANVSVKVLNASWDSGSVKSKKNNKVYTIQVTIDDVTWKIIRGDDALCELAKRLVKSKAEGSPLPPLVKKVVKRDQQGELGSSVETYLNQIQTKVAFGPKNSKTKAAYLKFFAPFSSRDEGMGNYPGGTADPEGWFIWKLGLA